MINSINLILVNMRAILIVSFFVALAGANEKACCKNIILDTLGMTNVYQGERLGEYEQIGQTASGRKVYKQQNGDNFLYYLEEKGYWMVGNSIGVDFGGIMTHGDDFCPEKVTAAWLYWSDWTDEWKEDSNLEADCNDGNGGGGDDDDNGNDGEDEPCATGNACAGCPIWSEVNGVRYCCANNCNYGSVSVEEENGHVVCHCRH